MDARGQLHTLHELEAQHDELLRELDALDRRICLVLQECTSHDEEELGPLEESPVVGIAEPEVASVS